MSVRPSEAGTLGTAELFDGSCYYDCPADAVGLEVVTKKEVFVTCYRQRSWWASREMAKAFYLEAMCACEGCERERYTAVYIQLEAGASEAFDDWEHAA